MKPYLGKDGKRQYNGLIDVYKKTLASDGICGLYRGFVISCVGIFIYRGLYFGIYDTAKPIFIGEGGSFLASFLLGWGVTVISGLASYPIDTIRRRMMMTSGTGVHYKSSMDCGIQVIKSEGFMSLMKGKKLKFYTVQTFTSRCWCQYPPWCCRCWCPLWSRRSQGSLHQNARLTFFSVSQIKMFNIKVVSLHLQSFSWLLLWKVVYKVVV